MWRCFDNLNKHYSINSRHFLQLDTCSDCQPVGRYYPLLGLCVASVMPLRVLSEYKVVLLSNLLSYCHWSQAVPTIGWPAGRINYNISNFRNSVTFQLHLLIFLGFLASNLYLIKFRMIKQFEIMKPSRRLGWQSKRMLLNIISISWRFNCLYKGILESYRRRIEGTQINGEVFIYIYYIH